MVIILKNLELAPISINAIPMGELDGIQEWLTDCTLTYTAGQASMAWKSLMNLVRNDDRFYEEYDETGQPKPAGWCFLQADDGEDEEMSDGDEDYHIEEDDEDDSDEDDDEDDDESEEDNDDHEDVADWESMDAESDEQPPA
mmetsp:Transcript_2912/g.8822  ORF Transcript_2912/g.8822 Transcript_2912/m.8822 type:complete len:142 (-) Transcript_2912:219-644(-)